jgi:glycogen debranching enzyme
MDTTFRAGKIVYSQAAWILALPNLSSLLSGLGRNMETGRLLELAKRTIQSVEKQLWTEEEGTYNDVQESHYMGVSYGMLTQDISLYLIAISENAFVEEDVLSVQFKLKTPWLQNTHKYKIKPKFAIPANCTLDTIKNCGWEDK